MKICKVEGCNGKYLAKGYCERHYNQFKYHGEILKRTIQDPNEIINKGSFSEIVLYNNKCEEVARAIIDSEDVEKIKEYKWHLDKYGYVATIFKGKWARIHHIIMGIKPSRKWVVDHKNKNRLINTKSNLRVCTNVQNGWNRKIHKNNTSGYKGVFWRKDSKKWRVVIAVNKKRIHLGSFLDKIEAAKAYNKAAIKHHGEFALLNRGV